MATLTWAPTASKPRAAVLLLSGTDVGGTVEFGDGAARTINPDAPLVHDYKTEGTYRARVIGADGAELASAQVVMREAIAATFAPSAAPGEENTVEVTFGGEHAAKVALDYGDGTAPATVWAVPGAVHSKFVKTGDYTGVVRDLEAKRVRRQDYEVVGPVADPDFTLTEDTGDPERNTAVLELTSVDTSQGEITVDWGYAGAVETIPTPQVGTKLTHTFDAAESPSGDGVFFVMAYYTSAADNPTVRSVTIPFSG